MHIAKHMIDGKQICFAIANAHDYIQAYHINGKFYERDLLNGIKSYCRPDRVFVDAGANVGNHTLFVSQFCDVLRVIPFECNPEALEILRMTLGVNDTRNVDTRYLGLALGDSSCAARIKRSVKDNLGGTQIEYGPAGQDYGPAEIQVITGDSVLYDEPVGVIKLDVEMTEFEVLAGMTRTIDRWRPVILMECVPERHEVLDAWAAGNGYVVKFKGWDNLLVPQEMEAANGNTGESAL